MLWSQFSAHRSPARQQRYSLQTLHTSAALDSERDIIIGDETTFSDWEYEGSAFSAYSTNDFPPDAVAVVRYLNEVSGNHVYSTSTVEQWILDQDSNWLNEGVAWYGDAFALISE